MRVWTAVVAALFFLKCPHQMVTAAVLLLYNYHIGVVVARRDTVRYIGLPMKWFFLNFKIISVDLIHITCQSSGCSAKDDLAQYTETLFKHHQWQEPDEVVNEEGNRTEEDTELKPRILWSMYFNIPICLKCEYADETPIPGLHLSCGPYFELDYDKSIEDVSEHHLAIILVVILFLMSFTFRRKLFFRKSIQLRNFCREHQIQMKLLSEMMMMKTLN